MVNMNDEITQRWEKTHLLDGLDGDVKIKCAYKLEECVNFLTGNMNTYMTEINNCIGVDGFFAGYILPIVRRMFSEDECPDKAFDVDLKWLFQDFGEFSKKQYKNAMDLEKNHSVDGGAEFVNLYMMRLKNVL